MASYLFISIDQLDENEVTESKPIYLDINTPPKSTNIASVNSKKPDQKPVFSNNDKLISHFQRKRRPAICVTKN